MDSLNMLLVLGLLFSYLFITHSQPLVFTRQPTPIYYVHSQVPLVIHCESTGISISYRKDSQDVHLAVNNSTYTVTTPIEGVTASREGIPYDCVASIPPTNAIVSSIGLVIYSYVINGDSGNIQIKLPSNVAAYIPCDYFIEAVPRPQFAWLKDGVEISGPEILPQTGALILNAFGDRTGVYTCVITNAYGDNQRLQSQRTYQVVNNADELEPHIWPVTNVTFVIGEERHLECVGNGVVCTFAKLNADNEQETLAAPVYITSPNYITITNVSHIHAGTYQIHVGSTHSVEFVITVEEPPTITAKTLQQEQIVYERGRVELSCTVTGTPEPTIEWFKDRVSQSTTSSTKTLSGEIKHNLLIEELQENDKGYYTCRASNKHGSAVRYGKLKVQLAVAPSLVQGPTPPSYTNISNSGQNLTITCVAMGDPVPPTLWWSGPDNIIINASTRYYLPTPVISGLQVTFSLVIIHADGLHNGDYYCHASNFKGTVSSVSATSVMIPGLPNIINIFPSNTQYEIQGNTHLIDCIATGDPQPEVTWWTMDTILMNDTDYTIFPNGSISISTLQLPTSNVFKCRAANPIQYVEKSYALDIWRCPSVDNLNIGTQSSPQNVNISVICSGNGLPTPSINWFHRKQDTSQSILLSENGSTLEEVTVTSVDDYLRLDIASITESNQGIYCCRATSTISLCESNTVEKCFNAIFNPQTLIFGLFELWLFIVIVASIALVLLLILLCLCLICCICVRYFKKDTYDIRRAANFVVPAREKLSDDSDDDNGEFDPTYESLPVNKPNYPPGYTFAPIYNGGSTGLPTYTPPPSSEMLINSSRDGGIMSAMAYPPPFDQGIPIVPDSNYYHSTIPSDNYSHEFMAPEMYTSQTTGMYMSEHGQLDEGYLQSDTPQFV